MLNSAPPCCSAAADDTAAANATTIALTADTVTVMSHARGW